MSEEHRVGDVALMAVGVRSLMRRRPELERPAVTSLRAAASVILGSVLVGIMVALHWDDDELAEDLEQSKSHSL